MPRPVGGSGQNTYGGGGGEYGGWGGHWSALAKHGVEEVQDCKSL